MVDYPDEIYSLWHHATSRRVIEDHLAPLLTGAGSAADFGCGAGYWLPVLADVPILHAVDFSEALLDQARARAPRQTRFHDADIGTVALPDPVDVMLCLNALMPESHADALAKLRCMADQVAPGGAALMVLFSEECSHAFTNLEHFAAARAGEEAAHLHAMIEDEHRWVDNPLGYRRHRNGGIVKHWIREEAELVFRSVGFEVKSYFKVPRDWDGPNPFGFEAWFHGWVLGKGDT